MRAPVYRSLEAKNTVLGLAFPTEFTVVLSAWWAGMIAAGAFVGSGIAVAAYVLVRAANYGRAEGFVQHFLQFKVRQLVSGSRLSAAARVSLARAPKFPHGEYGYEGHDLAARLFDLVRSRTGGRR
ncbi:hypothetical protein [Anaeromyxobacter oryzisoli]|uniref:hypothetical protein n=1 Tax=Anaeromyxobacter oryzisoli TaxID=2925408 RepID=UPI001F5A31D9|nr:hypothetical protein [Anaeromyxobacter sp. SG63]